MAINNGEALKAFRFTVSVGAGSAVAGVFTGFSGIKMKVDVMKGHNPSGKSNTKCNYPGLVRFSNAVFNCGVIGDSQFMDWIKAVASIDGSTPPTNTAIRKNIVVTALDDKGEPSIKWELVNALPVSYQLGAFSGGDSGIVTETLEFAISGFKRG